MQEQSERLYKVKRLVFEFIYFKSKAFDSIGRKRKNQVGEKFLGLIYQFPPGPWAWANRSNNTPGFASLDAPALHPPAHLKGEDTLALTACDSLWETPEASPILTPLPVQSRADTWLLWRREPEARP